MRLCEEYLQRNSLRLNYAKCVSRGFLYFDGGSKLLSIQWVSPLPHPGYYEISECVLGRSCHKLKSDRVEWNEYEPYLLSWLHQERNIVFDKSSVFDLTWNYFLRRNEKVMLDTFPVSHIYKTIDKDNSSRIMDCVELVHRLDALKPEVANFWRNRAFDLVALYCYWFADLRSDCAFGL